MFFNAKNRSIDTGKYIIDYFTFGKGDNIIVILPDIYGFTAITPKAISLVFQFRQLANDFSIYYFKRRRRLPYQHTIDEMANDQNEVMNILGIKNANILGLSMGGMVAQAVTIKYPDKVKRLVLGVTTSYPNEKMKNILNNWIKIAKDSNYKELIIDMVEKIYTEEYLRKMRRFYPLITRIGKPKSFRHFIIEAIACLTHNTFEKLHEIKCPTLIIGGANDSIIDKSSTLELADRIENNKLLLYENFGHSVIFEEKNCFNKIIDFLKNK